MISNLNTVEIEALSLISPGCNLKCSYCNIDKANKTSINNNFLQNSIKAIEDGSYLNNIQKVLKRLNQPRNKIKFFEIWGGEPTLLIPALNKKLEDWLNTFSYITDIEMSTNGIANIDELYNFCVNWDKYTQVPVRYGLQFSYDGLHGEVEARGVKDSLVLSNLEKLIDKLNTTKFNKLKIDLHMHCVISIETINNLDSMEKVYEFLKDYDEKLTYFRNKIFNSNLSFNTNDFINQNCGKFTCEYGLKLMSFIKNVDYLNNRYHFECLKNWGHASIATLLQGRMEEDTIELLKLNNCNSIDDFLNLMNNQPNDLILPTPMCPSVSACLRISHDGSVFDCHGSIHDLSIDKNLLDDTVFDQVRYYVAKANRYINYLTASDEEIEKNIDFYNKTHNPSITIAFHHQMVNLIYIMALAGQADKSYLYDINKLNRHALLLGRYNQCYHGLKLMNGSIFLRGPEEIRQACQGLLDQAENNINMLLKLGAR